MLTTRSQLLVKGLMAFCFGGFCVNAARSDDRLKIIQNGKPGDKIAFVLSVLEARERALNNFSISAIKTVENVSATGTRQFKHKDQFEVRRFGEKIWMQFGHYLDEAGKAATESQMSWDGHEARGLGLSRTANRSHPVGRIDPKEQDNFTTFRLSELLGFRVNTEEGPESVAEWLRNASKNGGKIAVDEDVVDSIAAIRVSVVQGIFHRTFWIDPSRDFMIIKFDYIAGSLERYNKETIQATKCKQWNDTWLPEVALCVSGLSGRADRTESTYSVSSASVGKVRSTDTDVTFPPHTEVVDAVRHVAYVTRDDGK
jgi:hypothetical protein